MKQYYATATNSKGANFIVRDLSEDRMEASIEAEDVCRKNGLIFQSIHSSGESNTATYLSKHAKARKKLRGVKGYKETF